MSPHLTKRRGHFACPFLPTGLEAQVVTENYPYVGTASARLLSSCLLPLPLARPSLAEGRWRNLCLSEASLERFLPPCVGVGDRQSRLGSSKPHCRELSPATLPLVAPQRHFGQRPHGQRAEPRLIHKLVLPATVETGQLSPHSRTSKQKLKEKEAMRCHRTKLY